MKKSFIFFLMLLLAFCSASVSLAETKYTTAFHDAWDQHNAYWESQDLTQAADTAVQSKDALYRILGTSVQITLPTGCNYYSSSNNSVYYLDSSTNLLLSFSRMSDYAAVSTWQLVLEQDGQDVSYGYTNDVLTAIGLKYASTGYQISCFFNTGGYSYLIMCTSATYNQAMRFIDILGTLCTVSNNVTPKPTTKPTATPLPSVSGNAVRILDTAYYVTLPAGASQVTNNGTTAMWNIPMSDGSILLLHFSQGLPGNYSSLENTYINNGYDVWHYTYNGVPTMIAETGSYSDSTKAVYTFFNANGYSYNIVATGMNTTRLSVYREITRTLSSGSVPVTPTPTVKPTPTPSPVPTAVPTLAPGSGTKVDFLSSGLTITLPADSYLSSSSSTRDYWFDPNYKLSFFLYEDTEYSSLNGSADYYKNFYDSVEWFVINDVPGFKTVQQNTVNPDLYAVKYYFFANGKVYYITPSSLKRTEMACYDSIVATVAFATPRTAFTLPRNTRTVEANAFYGTRPYKVVVPSGCTTIGSYAFANNYNLTVLHLPASITKIESTAFSGCSSELLIVAPAGSYAHTFATSLGYHVCTP